jgi:hypothetical protein
VPSYLLVVDMEFLAFDARFDEEPINYLLARAGHEPCDVLVLSLVDTHMGRLPTLDLMLGAGISGGRPMARAPRTSRDPEAEARHRMNRAARAVRNLGWRAEGAISHDSLVKAVGQETRGRHFDEVVLLVDPRAGHRLARWWHLRRLRHRLGERLVTFPLKGNTRP